MLVDKTPIQGIYFETNKCLCTLIFLITYIDLMVSLRIYIVKTVYTNVYIRYLNYLSLISSKQIKVVYNPLMYTRLLVSI